VLTLTTWSAGTLDQPRSAGWADLQSKIAPEDHRSSVSLNQINIRQ
jgi:hypothetical protein